MLNDKIRDITGATVGNTRESWLNPSEAGRIRDSIPNTDDGPSAYVSKYNDVIRDTYAAQARGLRFLETKDLKVMKQPLSDFYRDVPTEALISTEKAPTESQSLVDSILSQ